MNTVLKKRNATRKTRSLRVRKKLRGSADKPRLCVVKSNNHIHVQVVDDNSGKTLASASTLSKQFRNTEFAKKSKTSARKLGEHIAEAVKEQNISKVVFDRGRAKYHGILAELADAARAAGLQF